MVFEFFKGEKVTITGILNKDGVGLTGKTLKARFLKDPTNVLIGEKTFTEDSSASISGTYSLTLTSSDTEGSYNGPMLVRFYIEETDASDNTTYKVVGEERINLIGKSL